LRRPRTWNCARLGSGGIGRNGIPPGGDRVSSVAAIVGGDAYAVGIKGRAIWNNLLRVLSNRSDVMSKLL
jgi:hypothetical protein